MKALASRIRMGFLCSDMWEIKLKIIVVYINLARLL